MARYIGPVCRLCRREGMKLFLKGERCYTDKCASSGARTRPASTARRARRSSSATACSCARSRRSSASTACSSASSAATTRRPIRTQGHHRRDLLQLLERRLDNVVYRLGFAVDRAEARQLVRHGHFTVNGKQVDIPSYLVQRRATSIEVARAVAEDRRASSRRSTPSTAAACRSGSSSTRRTSRARSTRCRRAKT